MLATQERPVFTQFRHDSDDDRPWVARPQAAIHSVPRLDLTEVPDVRIAGNMSELLAAFRLVYRRYAERGLVAARPNGIIYSSEFSRGDSRTLVALNSRGDVSATATFVAEPDDPSVQGVIPWRLIQSYDPSRRLGGVTCLASLGSVGGPSPAAFFSLARYLFQYAKHRGYDGLAITIHPRQLRFYGRICPIVPLGPVYRQPKLGNALAVACRIDLDSQSLASVHPGVLSWFETPIPAAELNRPGIRRHQDLILASYADGKGYTTAARQAQFAAACA
jgi:hypothetical protein